MLMRSPTRIEFKAEDAQEYIRNRERLKKQGGAGAGSFSCGSAVGGLGGSSPMSPPSSQLFRLDSTPGAAEPSSALGPLAGSRTASSVTTLPPVFGAAAEAAAMPAAGLPQAAPAAAAAPMGGAVVTPTTSVPAQLYPQVEQLVQLGFSVEQARQALAASGGDVDVAADSLFA
eukprot:TRINITY_DN76608_c0_g1_i1.p1 TRINITY_DN76608_c0_g1~~TRINITY_DN76608_c0_g1_i1.p1  ORF type:complete len:173 (-),score=48.42 TRINITY_DN76608_c0_g1_i1:203-721(-)